MNTLKVGDEISWSLQVMTAAGPRFFDQTGVVRNVERLSQGFVEAVSYAGDSGATITSDVDVRTIDGWEDPRDIHPIIFSEEMVKSIKAGRKLQTRRLASSPLRKVKRGDLLYVREAWRSEWSDMVTPSSIPEGKAVHYEADGPPPSGFGRLRPSIHMPRHMSRFVLEITEIRFQSLQDITEEDAIDEGVLPLMRQVMEGDQIVNRTLYRNYQISEEKTFPTARESFWSLWRHLHTKPGTLWRDNPQVIALTFEVEKRNVDA